MISNVASSIDASSNVAISIDASSNVASSIDASSNVASSNVASSNVASSNVASSNVASSNVASSILHKKFFIENKNFKVVKGVETTIAPATAEEKAQRRLYLMIRSLEVLRKFNWMILGGRFNQLSHVSSPILSKPGEY
ncbi:hypothetical protein Tco_0266048 [Tanacetum coccineum]